MPNTNVGCKNKDKRSRVSTENKYQNVSRCRSENYEEHGNADRLTDGLIEPKLSVNYPALSSCQAQPDVGSLTNSSNGEFESIWAATSKALSRPVTLASVESLSVSSGTNQSVSSLFGPRNSLINALPVIPCESSVRPKSLCDPSCPSVTNQVCPSKCALRRVSSCKAGNKSPYSSVNYSSNIRASKSTGDLQKDKNTGISLCTVPETSYLKSKSSEFHACGDITDNGSRVKGRWRFSSGFGEPSLYHALVVIFLEFFAWGLLTSPMIQVLKETFPDHTFLMNGIIMGIKGILSFLSAPLIGALSDLWGRKFFLFITVFFTCIPIPFMKINTWWYFALISMSGVFAVTYSIVFAYVADVTDENERHYAYGLVSATFAASLVTSPAVGAYLGRVHSDDLVVGLATAIAVLDIFFILVAVPESLPEKVRLPSNWNNTQISWEQADPFSALLSVSKDKNILLICVTVFLSYLPEAGQFSCFFVYLQLVMGFGPELVATFIAMLGILSVIAQTAVLSLLIKTFSNKKVISIGLFFELLQMMWYGFGSQAWMIWAAGVLAAISSITYPAISSYVSTHTDADKQGVVQGIVTGMRGLCAGLGPAMFGFIFYLFQVDLNEDNLIKNSDLPGGGSSLNTTNEVTFLKSISQQVPGPPFVFGAMMVLLALTVSAFIPEGVPKNRKQPGSTLDLGYNRDHKKNDSLDGTSQPLINETGIL